MKAKEEYVDVPRETRSKDITVYAIIFLVLLVGAGIFLAVKLLHKPADAALASSKSGIVYDSSAVEGGWDNLSPEEIAEKLNEKVAEGMINISMNTAPYFEDGKAEGNVMIVNESINNYPQQVEFIRNDTGEQVYQSNAIPVGSKIERAALDVELPAGTYECTAMFHNLDPESGAIAIGSKIERAKLDVDLPAGTYECTAYFHNLNPETGDIIGTAGAIITITIKN